MIVWCVAKDIKLQKVAVVTTTKFQLHHYTYQKNPADCVMVKLKFCND